MLRVEFEGTYFETLAELLEEQSDLLDEIDKRIKWFRKNPEDTRLDNHPLRKSMQGKWAFSITKDIRIVYEWLGKTSVRFLAIGHHHKIYPTH